MIKKLITVVKTPWQAVSKMLAEKKKRRLRAQLAADNMVEWQANDDYGLPRYPIR